MKRIVLILALGLFWAQGAFATDVTFVEKQVGTVCSFCNNTTAATITATIGNQVFAIVYSQGAARSITSVVGSVNGSYTAISGATAHNATGDLYVDAYAVTASSGSADTVTVTFSTTVNASWVALYESTAGVVDTATATTGNSGTPSAGSITPAANGSFVVAGALINDGFGLGSTIFNAGTSFTLGNEQGGGNFDSGDEYYNQATAASVAGAFTTNFGVSGQWAAVVFDFKPSGGGGGGAAPSRLGLLGVGQ